MDPNLETSTNSRPMVKGKQSVTGWFKANLFSGWFNSILTIVSATVIVLLLNSVFTWVFTQANWSVIAENFKLFFVGQYPLAQMWRPWLSLLILMLLIGLSYGAYRNGILRIVFYFFNALLTLVLFLPFVAWSSKAWLVGGILIAFLGMIVGHKFPKVKKFTLVGWLLLYPLFIFLMNGFGILPTVRTNAWGGLLLNIIIAGTAIVVSFPIGVLLALGRRSKLPVIKVFCVIFIETIRGVPLVAILAMAMLMFPLFLPAGFQVDNLIRIIIAVTIFNSAYVAENVRGGLQSISRSQYEAADALGLNAWKRTTFIILPQALRITVPSMVGQSISIFKDTTLVALVSVVDLLGIGRAVMANPAFLGTQKEIYIFVALIFWIFCYFMSLVSKRIEKSLKVTH
ncbi:amino acid ABC transporter permease [Alkalihalobacillus sp. 1P02AB]|uniref:amino acid ABC transporter permease n=1 Tax=Alkalihalobacillus sp. 1P02AB TaxID=3132260 RepID=UPI0039A42755